MSVVTIVPPPPPPSQPQLLNKSFPNTFETLIWLKFQSKQQAVLQWWRVEGEVDGGAKGVRKCETIWI